MTTHAACTAHTARTAHLCSQIKDLRTKKAALESDLESLDRSASELRKEMERATRDLTRARDEKMQRVLALKRITKQEALQKAYEVVQDAIGRGAFEGEVYGPIVAEVHVQDALIARYLVSACT